MPKTPPATSCPPRHRDPLRDARGARHPRRQRRRGGQRDRRPVRLPAGQAHRHRPGPRPGAGPGPAGVVRAADRRRADRRAVPPPGGGPSRLRRGTARPSPCTPAGSTRSSSLRRRRRRRRPTTVGLPEVDRPARRPNPAPFGSPASLSSKARAADAVRTGIRRPVRGPRPRQPLEARAVVVTDAGHGRQGGGRGGPDVAAGDLIAVVEAMKMENPVKAPWPGSSGTSPSNPATASPRTPSSAASTPRSGGSALTG